MMQTAELTPAEAAMRVYIGYAQLKDLLGELSKRIEYGVKQPGAAGMYWTGAVSYARGFNAILRNARAAFASDETFLESIQDLVEIKESTDPAVMEFVLSQGSKLRGALAAFVSVYMGAEEKRKIGFTPNPD